MATLTLGQAIRNSIAVEQGAERFYRRLAEEASDAAVRDFFADMAEQERGHARSIEDLGRERPVQVPALADRELEIVEAAPAWEAAGSLTLEQAFELAIEAEGHAALYYDIIADQTTGEVSAFYRQLSAAEELHLQHLQEMRRRTLK
jgi:rubrerythrin